MQGLSYGLYSIATYAVDTAPESPIWLGTTVISGSPMLGLTCGAFGSGLLKESS
ncbi:hypothetical protein MTZ49_08930 [Entomomonas sp. E2T0]|uniref:hypothetical protein n=1 Tax=Entomomonas sp. E2T0 TaxID=2930213 RepID=UPI00222815BB|nr:hypothetical protein [Entomomonas sp. E2T0]UYZ82739.1 hypothetical protein MTZ49_08930 [Entomomonas sp. E2T0]